MFSRRKEEKPRRSSGNKLSQFGLFDIPDNFNDVEDSIDDDNDSDLEAELMAITSGNKTKPKRPIRKKVPEPVVNLDAMVAESLKDIPSDEEVSDNEDDPELLNELNTITQVESEEEKEPEHEGPKKSSDIISVLEDRIKMYTIAEENAKKANESSRARRFNRGIKTLKDLLKQAKVGKPIKEEDIPPVVSINAGVKPTAVAVQPITNDIKEPETNLDPVSLTEPIQDNSSHLPEDNSNNVEKENILKLLNQRKSDYKLAALQAKKSGDSVTAVKYIKICKQFDAVLAAVENNQPVDLSKMPGPPSINSEDIHIPPKEENELQQSSDNQNPTNSTLEISENISEEIPQLISASSIAEALEQHYQKYKSVEQQAKEEGNSSKARRIGRIIKQYEQAIKLHKAGKPFPVEELPTPPGYAPIPVENKTDPPKQDVNIPKSEENETPSLSEKSKYTVPSNINQDSGDVPKTTGSIRKTGNQTSTSFNEKQLAFLLARQKEFKEAAINAKKKGEINQAKEFLRTAKGFDPLIEAAKCGLPVDMSTVPIPPSARSELEDGFDIVMAAECIEDDSGVLDILSRLEEQLTKQLKMCMSTRDHHKALGDVAGANRFEQLALSVTRDLDIIRIAKRTGNVINPPQHHYEEKNFSIVKSFTDLNDDELELEIVRGINYRCNNPKEIDTYVKFEFPFPQEEPFREKTDLIRDTNNPEYNAKYLIPIQRNSRACLRVFKRHGVKFEICSRGGFFRSDSILGTVTVKLQPLETLCELHESYDLLDGRKPVGGKLEIKIRIRNPLLTKQVEQLSEKWLVIDH